MGLPSKMDIDLSAVHVNSILVTTTQLNVLTTEKKPENPPSNFTFYGIKTVVRGFFVHAERHSNVRSLPECCVLCGIVPLAKMIHAVAILF